MKRKITALETAGLPVLLPLLLLFVSATMAQDNVRLTCDPRTFHVVAGEPIRLRLTVQADSAVPFRWHVPAEPLLKLRAIEKLPVRLTRDSVVVFERVVIWQALEPGTVKINTLSIETKGKKLVFPEITMTVGDATP